MVIPNCYVRRFGLQSLFVIHLPGLSHNAICLVDLLHECAGVSSETKLLRHLATYLEKLDLEDEGGVGRND